MIVTMIMPIKAIVRYRIIISGVILSLQGATIQITTFQCSVFTVIRMIGLQNTFGLKAFLYRLSIYGQMDTLFSWRTCFMSGNEESILSGIKFHQLYLFTKSNCVQFYSTLKSQFGRNSFHIFRFFFVIF